MSQEKMWGSEPFWGLGYDWDPDWVLTDRHKELRAKLIELLTDLSEDDWSRPTAAPHWSSPPRLYRR